LERLINSNISQQIVNQDPNQMPEDFRSYLNQPPEKMDSNAIKYWSLGAPKFGFRRFSN